MCRACPPYGDLSKKISIDVKRDFLEQKNTVNAMVDQLNQPNDAILMDCQMPELNGCRATAAIRAQEGEDRRTPIIAMTAGARREDEERCLAEGMDGDLAKPMTKAALLALVEQSLHPDGPVTAPRSRIPSGA